MKGMIKVVAALMMGLMAASTMGCASTRQMAKLPNQSVRIENPEMARIYVVRPSFVGGAISMEVNDGDKTIGTTGGKGFLCWERQPGATTLSSKAENTSTLPLQVEKNTVYYVQQRIHMGFMMARNELVSRTEAEGQEDLKSCKPPKVSE